MTAESYHDRSLEERYRSLEVVVRRILSQRSHFDSRPNALTTALSARRVAGRAHVDLTVSNPTVAGLPYEEGVVRAALSVREGLVYQPSPFGIERARVAVTKLWQERGFTVDAAHVALTASTSEAYAVLFKLLCDPGDVVLVPSPSYPLFEYLARLEGVETRAYPLVYDGAWHVDVGACAALVTERTRAIVVVSPNNPTGSFLSRDELSPLARLGLPIISDEVFGAYALREAPGRMKSVLEAEDCLVFALDGLSKFAGLPQLKLAWITAGGPLALVREAFTGLELVLDTYLSPGGPVQYALSSLLDASALTRRAILARIRHNAATLAEAATGSAVSPLFTEGGWSHAVRLPAVMSEEAWTLGLLGERDVLVQPGYFYDFVEEPVIVLSLLTEEASFEYGVRRLVEYVERAI